MLFRVIAAGLILFAVFSTRAQEALVDAIPQVAAPGAGGGIESAWLDLRQTSPSNAKPQAAAKWVESVTIVPTETKEGVAPKTIFRIRLARPRPEFQVLLFRLFFDDNPEEKPNVVAWDESGTQVVQSGPLGLGVSLPTSESVMIPMGSMSTIDIEVPGDGKTVRGAYLDWMASAEVLHPISAEHRDLIPEPFTAVPPLHAGNPDTEMFGTVTATLAPETILIGSDLQQGAAFQFPLETQPLVALLSFEVASPNIDAPPQVLVNGENLGAATLMLPDLADPAYRGMAAPLVRQMRFQYTGWLRAQKLVPASSLRAGTNDVIVVGGAGTRASAIRATQIQLKYLWDKSDYQLQTDR